MDNEILRVGRLSLVEGRLDHARMIADSLRMFDARECYIHGSTPLEALTEPFTIPNSTTYSIRHDDTVIAMCGTVPVEIDTARVWMLGTGGINQNAKSFLRGCKKVINILQSNYLNIENFVPIDHHDTIMWLSWCGFVFDGQSYEINGHHMVRFVRCVKTQNNVYSLKRPVMH